MHRFLTLVLASATVSGGLIGAALLVTPAAASTAKASPTIVARPDSVMVDRTTRLTGTHLPAKTTITIEESAEQNWIAPQDPCDTTNALTVTTNGAGRFKGVLTVHTCSTSGTPGFSETCYVGEPKGSGVDTVTLVGSVAITVTGP